MVEGRKECRLGVEEVGNGFAICWMDGDGMDDERQIRGMVLLVPLPMPIKLNSYWISHSPSLPPSPKRKVESDACLQQPQQRPCKSALVLEERERERRG